jgi:hypothetical protein
MYIVRDREKHVLNIDVRRHIYDFIRSIGLDPNSSASLSHRSIPTPCLVGMLSENVANAFNSCFDELWLLSVHTVAEYFCPPRPSLACAVEATEYVPSLASRQRSMYHP